MAMNSRETARERAQAALNNSPVFDLRELNVEEVGDTLLISGRVTSFYHKQLAQEAVRSVVGPSSLMNEVHVTCDG